MTNKVLNFSHLVQPVVVNYIQLHYEIMCAIITVTVGETICTQPAENLKALFLPSESEVLKHVQAFNFISV